MSFARSQYLRVFDAAGATYQRWQSYHAWTAVSWDSATWIYQPFQADGFTAGLTGDEGAITITAPATPLVLNTVARALAQGHLLELKLYQFDPAGGDATPPNTQELIAAFTGEIIGASETLTDVRIELGSSLAPVGAQIPPRTFVTRLIGKGCRL
jgi:hypothetical protein